jgi:hypothetical protein
MRPKRRGLSETLTRTQFHGERKTQEVSEKVWLSSFSHNLTESSTAPAERLSLKPESKAAESLINEQRGYIQRPPESHLSQYCRPCDAAASNLDCPLAIVLGTYASTSPQQQ